MRRALCWIRRDLRLSDHVALCEATHQADGVAVVFIFDTNILSELKDRNDRRLTFIHESLVELDAKLKQHGSRLIVRHGDPIEEIPNLVRLLDADALFTNRDYEPYGVDRDRKIAQLLGEENFHSFKDMIVLEPQEVAKADGQPFHVFSPFQRCWWGCLDEARDLAEHRPNLRRLMPAAELAGLVTDWRLDRLGFEAAELWLEAGEDAAKQRLRAFQPKMKDYGTARNLPAEHGASGLSVHLRFGTISIRECFRRALDEGSNGASKWASELIWREFYQHILFHYPEVVSEPFQSSMRGIAYPENEAGWKAWVSGETGYPIVDAAMRAFGATGYMHNRLRMIAASFLTKDLLIDYRRGEAYFARYLLDFELGSNNGGWQWSASTGVDPNPWFRIFNPVLQGEKFDPKGEFVKEWLPELKGLDEKWIHKPWEAPEFDLLTADVRLGENYPKPIVDHQESRTRALAFLKSAKR